MKSLILIISIIFSSNVFANENLAKEKNCMACHSIDKKIVGPAFKDIATKYKNDKNANEKLKEKVMKGGSGVWGPVPMPPNPITAKEAETLVQYVLNTNNPKK